MNKIYLIFIITLAFTRATAQVTSINEDFNSTCTSSGQVYPAGWLEYNHIAPFGQLGWNCNPSDGRWGTPCLEVSGFYSGAYHADTALIMTPLLNVSGYPGEIYLRFDTKTTNLHSGARLTLLRSKDATFAPNMTSEITSSITPVFGNSDSSDWVTHQVDLTGYKVSGAFYLAWRYTSSSTAGSIWYLDNINTTTAPLDVPEMDNNSLPIRVLGSNCQGMDVFFNSIGESTYRVEIYDMMGREIYKNSLEAREGDNNVIVRGSYLHPGIYIVKVGNGERFGAVKTVVQ